MDFAATQVYEDEDFLPTQRISHTLEEEELVQIGTLSINSIDHQIKRGITKIGRLGSCDIVLKDMSVSKIHAEIEASGQGSTWICDLQSSNKTKLNNLTLRPTRSYELKDRSVIEFGKVRAIYRTYRSANDTVIPDTPAPTRQKVAGRRSILNIPDSSLSNSSTVDDDDSIIFGTQKDEENRVFRQPQVPQQRQSTSIGKTSANASRTCSISESDDSQIGIALRLSNSDISENQGVSIFDTETQNFEGHKTVMSSSIHDLETQKFSTNTSNLFEANVKTDKQLSKRDKIAENPVANIHDVETQNYMDNVDQQWAQKSDTNVQNITARRYATNIYDVETQNFPTNMSKLLEANIKIDKRLSKRDKLAENPVANIHDVETQNDMDNVDQQSTKKSDTNVQNTARRFATNIHDMETQNYINNSDKDDTETQKSKIDKNEIQIENIDRIKHSIHDLETQKIVAEDISNMETQFESGIITNEISSAQTNKDKTNVSDAIKGETNYENITKLSTSRSSSPGSLNLSSPGVNDEDYPSSNQSAHLLESTDLLEYFSDGIDKQVEVQASTPKPHSKTSFEGDNKVRNIVIASDEDDNDNENDEENIFDVPTQRMSCKFDALESDDFEKNDAFVTCKVPKKKPRKSRPKQTSDDSETDAEEYFEELTEKQRESLETSNRSCNENTEIRNDPGSSVESEDMFNMLTQQLKNRTTKDTSNSSIDELSKTNKTDAIVDNAAPTQVINIIGNTRDKGNPSETLSTDINDAATQIVLREASPKIVIDSKDPSSENNSDDIDDTAPTQIINENRQIDTKKSVDRHIQQELDYEDLDYEMAPTQVIDEVEEQRNSAKENFGREKTVESSKVDLNDTLERNLNEMFDGVNSEIHEQPQLSTQCLEDILESPQCDNDLSANSRFTVGDDVSTNNVPQTKRGKRRREHHDQSSEYDLPSIKANKNNPVDTESQNCGPKELVDSIENIILSQGTNSPRISEGNAEDDDTSVKSNKTKKRTPKTKNKSDAMTDDLIHDGISKTILSDNNERNVRKSTRRKDRTVSKRSERVLARKNSSEVKVDDAGKDLEDDASSVSCPSENGQRTQKSNILYESDDDILTRLPAVRISGTLSNPPSPSGSSTSTVHSMRSKGSVAEGRSKVKYLTDKLRKRYIQDTEKVKDSTRTNDKSSTAPDINLDSHSSCLDSEIPKTGKTPKVTNISEHSDSEGSYKRFKQMANRMLKSELSYLQERSEGNVKNTQKSAVLDEKKSTVSSSDISKDPNQNVDIESSKRSLRTSSRTTRYSTNRNNDETSCVFQMTKEVCTEKTIEDSAKLEAKSTAINRKRSLKIMKEDVEQINSKKCKTDKVIEERPLSTRGRRNTTKIVTGRQSPNIVETLMKTRSRAYSPVIGSAKFSKEEKVVSKTASKKDQKAFFSPKSEIPIDASIDSGKSNVKEARRKINDSAAMCDMVVDANSTKNKQAREKGRETEIDRSQGKILKVLLNPIVGFESQEVEMIMRKTPSYVREDKDLSIKEKSNVRTLRRDSRSVKGKKRPNANAEADTASNESNVSSDTSDSDSAVPNAKRGRSAKSSVSLLRPARVPEKMKKSKKPTRIDVQSSLDLTKSSTSIDSQDDAKSNASSSSRSLRSKAIGTKKMEKIEMNQSSTRSMADDSISSGINTSVETTSFASTPSRARRNMSSSILSNSSPSASRQRILFTGITEDKYCKIVKTLGGSKVEDSAKCTVLVTDKVRRTYKFLCALAKGVPIVAIDWLKDSESSGQFLDWESYILKDPAAEAKFGFRLRKSLDKAKEKRLLDGYTVVLTPGVAPPPIEELKDMITSCGGKALLRPPAKWPEKAVIVSREEDMPNARKFLAKAPKIVTVQSTEFILTGILRQETDFDKFKLT